ncbi:hypothetical protein Q2T83_07865 [Fervidibacter sacchari]|uniref:Uncharacterized protein n=1 Tax=Candidatus Fervidibacter sacchari TaxID=1448929 RepID=A0ABT2ENM0_9BACT|nr:hypothetical protein [Candidatus Fervidibacter sacchari]MCS3918508.1 hypothetical protein [Candidatus Fervidibacter sacchari]WKU17725.1 hypothetical protein Q2T83_07865 [Candidatus Fervidibacter sacchari]
MASSEWRIASSEWRIDKSIGGEILFAADAAPIFTLYALRITLQGELAWKRGSKVFRHHGERCF